MQQVPSFLTLLGNMFCESRFSVTKNPTSSMNAFIKVKNALDSSEYEILIVDILTSLN